MELAHTLTTSLVVASVGGLVAWAMVGQFRSLHRELDVRFDVIDQRFTGVDRQFAGIDQRFAGIEQRFDGIDQRFDGMDQRFDGLERRLERVEGSIDALRSDLTQVALAVGARPRAQNG